MSQVDVSIFIPVYNEEESLEILQNKIETSMQATNISYEIVYVDDGSKDKSFEILEAKSMRATM